MPLTRIKQWLSPILDAPLYGSPRRRERQTQRSTMDESTQTEPEEGRADSVDDEETDNYFNPLMNSTANPDINEQVVDNDANNEQIVNEEIIIDIAEDESADLTAEEQELQRQLEEATRAQQLAQRRQRIENRNRLRRRLQEIRRNTSDISSIASQPTSQTRPTAPSQPNINANVPLDHNYTSGVAQERSSSTDKLLEIITRLNLGPQNQNNAVAPKPAVFKQPPPKFDGDRDQAMDWLKDYEAIAQINIWNEDNKAVHLITALTGDAKTWYDGVYDGRRPNWTEFETEFLAVYKPVDYDCEVRQKVYTLRQNFNETPTAFINRFIKRE